MPLASASSVRNADAIKASARSPLGVKFRDGLDFAILRSAMAAPGYRRDPPEGLR
jgi:hypothetical protein